MRHHILRPAAAVLGLAGAVLAIAPNALAATSIDAGQIQLAQAPGPGRGAPQQPQSETAAAEQQLGQLQRQLRLTPQQQPQFDAFAQVMRQNAQSSDTMMKQGQQAKNAVDDLRAYAQFTQSQADGLKRLLPALEAFYGALSDQQKRVVDQMFGPGAAGH